MPIAFLSPELSRWDQLAETQAGPPEALLLPFFSDERPLRGAAGLADWRLCGRLSKLLMAGRVSGAFGESTLLPAVKLPFEKLVLFGLGSSDRFDEVRYREAARAVRKVLASLTIARYALPLPGRSTGRIMARRAMELWLAEDDRQTEVWLVEAQAGQKEMSEVIGRVR